MLHQESEEMLVTMFSKVKSNMNGRSNQFEVASKLIYFPVEFIDRNVTSLDEDKRRLALFESTAKYFGLPSYTFTNGFFSDLSSYIATATPAAIVQMVKRKKIQVQN